MPSSDSVAAIYVKLATFHHCLGRQEVATSNLKAISYRFLNPIPSAAGEDRLQMAFEEGAGVLEVLFCVGFGGGDARKRLVEDADDPPLLKDLAWVLAFDSRYVLS